MKVVDSLSSVSFDALSQGLVSQTNSEYRYTIVGSYVLCYLIMYSLTVVYWFGAV